MYKWLLLAHAIGGATLFGGHVYLESLTAAASKAVDDVGYMTVMMKASNAAERVMTAASIVTLVFGVWLVFDRPQYGFEDLFITIGFAAIIIAFAVSMFLMGPRFKEIKELVDENGYGDEAALTKMKSFATFIHVQTLIVAVAFVVMIVKPGF
jgi:uncharacterized membrane protein